MTFLRDFNINYSFGEKKKGEFRDDIGLPSTIII